MKQINKYKKQEIAELLRLHAVQRQAIRRRLRAFAEVRRSSYFYEILYCLLTPQTSAANADKAVERLRELSFETQPIDPEPILRDGANYVRFHRVKSGYLFKLKEEFPRISAALRNGAPAVEIREWLVGNVKGLGLKEATHFLRNVGRNGGLTILDRHILRNLKRYGVIRSLPVSLSRKSYLAIEKRFITFSNDIGIPVDELDLLFWSMETGEIRK
ncbi:MAG TPA: DNA lyase [Bacteroidetes bacterium]|nr:DNA lyase [Bacteroidota bacterium]